MDSLDVKDQGDPSPDRGRPRAATVGQRFCTICGSPIEGEGQLVRGLIRVCTDTADCALWLATRNQSAGGAHVVVRPEHRHRFNPGSPAARGETLRVLGRSGSAWAIGPNPLDYAYAWELEIATPNREGGADRG